MTRNSALGPMSKNSAEAKHYRPPVIEFAIPDRITNANSTGFYSQVEAHRNSAQRPGCQDFLSCRSVGTPC